MIDPITGLAVGQTLVELTEEMTGLTLADAWAHQEFQDPVDAGYGVDFGVNVINVGGDKPAISGNTNNSFIDSQEVDPVDAFDEYVLNDPSSVSSTTGGIVEGSKVASLAYSLLQTYPSVGQEVVKAVLPVAIPIERAYIAISQALGVSMNAADMGAETKQAFTNAIVNGAGLVYDKAKGLVKAWWDGVNILFPRRTVQAVQDTIDEFEIGEGGTATSDIINYDVPVFTGLVADYELPTNISTPTSAIAYNSENNFVFYVNSQGSKRLLFAARTGENITYTRISAGVHKVSGEYVPYYTNYNYSSSGGNTVIYENKSCTYVGTSLSNSVSPFPITWPDGEVISNADEGKMAWTSVYGEIHMEGYPEGTQQSQAQSYNPSNIPSAGGIATSDSTAEDVVPINLPQDWSDTTDSTVDPVTTPTDQEEVDTLPRPPIPLPIPDTNVSNPDVPLVNPSVVNSTLVDALVDQLANTLDPQAPQSSGLIPVPLLPGIPDGQGGSSYPSIVPSSGSGLIHVYNPTPAEMVSFGNWLWVTYADTTIDKIWNNPFDGIIGAHELYATPQTDGSDNIRSGFLVCPTTAALVRQRYTEIDCGNIIVPEIYGNYLDYSPYSQAYIYLPFIGINEVSIDDIVGHAVNIRYRIDAYNGSCIAMVYVAKENYRNLCYQFAGNCAVEVPLAGGSQAAIKAGVMQAEAYARAGMMQAVGHLFGGFGSALLGNLGGILSSAGGIISNYANASAGVEAARVANKSTVQHSGTFGASHGAMGYKTPFIIIRNPIQVKVVNYNHEYGFPAHKRVIVGGCTGYLRVREVNVISANATDEEKIMIEALLKNGVYVS